MENNNKLNIGLFGFGVVGEGIYKVLKETPSLNASITRIAIKNKDKNRNAPQDLFTTDANELLTNNEINVIVELIDDADAAYTIVTTALKNKKHVVSANKKMIATHLTELIKLQQENKVSLLYEASVCGSIPVIRNLEEYYDNDLLNSFSGIVNGSTNFILTKMTDEKLSYANALEQAQQLGFAESNPALDVEGIDAVNKLTIILKHAYGIDTKPTSILHKGITQLHEADSQFAQEKGYSIKLIANAIQLYDNEVVAFVLPSFIDSSNQLFTVKNEFNGVLIGSKFADNQFLYGKGAGRFPTSSAVLSDISALRYNYQYEYKKSHQSLHNQLSADCHLHIYVSFNSHRNDIEEDFLVIDEAYKSSTRNYIIGKIDFTILRSSKWINDTNVSIIVMGDDAVKSFIEIQTKEFICS